MFASLPEQKIHVPGTCTRFVSFVNDGRSLTVIGKSRSVANLTFLMRKNFQSCRQPLYLTHSTLLKLVLFFFASLTFQPPQRLPEVDALRCALSSRDLLSYALPGLSPPSLPASLPFTQFTQRNAVLHHPDGLTPTNVDILFPFSAATSQLRLSRPLQ
jgi:hypothetical protein